MDAMLRSFRIDFHIVGELLIHWLSPLYTGLRDTRLHFWMAPSSPSRWSGTTSVSKTKQPTCSSALTRISSNRPDCPIDAATPRRS
jgi:hypothetical protein